MIAAVTTDAVGVAAPEPGAAAITLRARLPQSTALSKPERDLLDEWLTRIASAETRAPGP